MPLEKFFDLIVNKHLTFSRLSEFEGYEALAGFKEDAIAYFEDLYNKGADRDVIVSLISGLTSCESQYYLVRILKRTEKVNVSEGSSIYGTNTISRRIAYPASKRWFCLCFSQKETEDYLLWSVYTRGRAEGGEFCTTQLACQVDMFFYAPGKGIYPRYNSTYGDTNINTQTNRTYNFRSWGQC